VKTYGPQRGEFIADKDTLLNLQFALCHDASLENSSIWLECGRFCTLTLLLTGCVHCWIRTQKCAQHISTLTTLSRNEHWICLLHNFISHFAAACMNPDTHLQSRTRRHGPHTDQLFCNWHCLAVRRSLREGLMVWLSRAKQGQTPTECYWVSKMGGGGKQRWKLCSVCCSTLTSPARRRQVWRHTGTCN
jgi:hypothetical protein